MAEHVCLYAVVSGADGPVRGTGAWGEKLRRIRVAGLDLVIGETARAPRPTIVALERYDAVMRRLSETHAGILPARFGTTVPALDALAAPVADRRAALRRNLRLVRHRVQMTVRVFGGRTRVRVDSDPGTTLPAPGVRVDSDPGTTLPGRVTGRQFLQRRARDLQVPGAEPLRDAVKRWVRAERIERHTRGRLTGTIYHLVPRRAPEPYSTAIRHAAETAGLAVVVTGPWPPYAFAEEPW